MLDSFAGLPWITILVASLAYYVLGALWFTPLFGRAWDAAIGHTRGGTFSAAYYLVPLISSVLVSVAAATVIESAGLETVADGFVMGLVLGAGVAGAVSVNNALTPHTPRPFVLGFVTGGYHLAGITIVCVVLTAVAR